MRLTHFALKLDRSLSRMHALGMRLELRIRQVAAHQDQRRSQLQYRFRQAESLLHLVAQRI